MKTIIKVKRLTDSARLPIRGHNGDDWGLDLFVDTFSYIRDPNTGCSIIQQVSSGLAVEIESDPPIYGYDLRARSSVYKMKLMPCNGIGTIDINYRGSLNMNFYCMTQEPTFYGKGDRFAQLVLPATINPHDIEVVEVLELSDTTRGSGGFGSTGK